jgi:hypothetical protein
MMRSGTAQAEAVLGGEPIWVIKRSLQRRSFTYVDAAVRSGPWDVCRRLPRL